MRLWWNSSPGRSAVASPAEHGQPGREQPDHALAEDDHRLGYLRSEGQRANDIGRPSIILTFDETNKLILAVDLGATHARMALTDATGSSIAETALGLHIDAGPEQILGIVRRTFREMLDENDRDVDDVCGIGVGVPGPVDFEAGRVRNPPMMPGWHDYPIKENHPDGSSDRDGAVRLRRIGMPRGLRQWRGTGPATERQGHPGADRPGRGPPGRGRQIRGDRHGRRGRPTAR
jgi:hypothetical protein